MNLPLNHNAIVTLDTALNSLTLSYASVELCCKGGDVAQILDQDSHIPGVVLTQNETFVGVISRQQFWRHMSRPYSLELYLNRPIALLYELTHKGTLCLPEATTIIEAFHALLHRHPSLLDEPIVVVFQDGRYGVLGAHQLLIAAAQVHQLTTHLLQESSHQLKIANWELQRLAALDGLTEIANRRRFDEYLMQVFQGLIQAQLPLTLLLADVDFFKAYNDHYGHPQGDRCLQQIAQCLQQQFQAPGFLVARYGGEEFAMILPQCDAQGTIPLIQSLQTALHHLNIAHPKSIISDRITLSIGAASLVPHPLTTAADLVNYADQALYAAKHQGRNRYVLKNGAERNCQAVQA